MLFFWRFESALESRDGVTIFFHETFLRQVFQ